MKVKLWLFMQTVAGGVPLELLEASDS